MMPRSLMLALLALSGSPAGAAPVSPGATAKAAQVLSYLQGLPAGSALRVLSGQNVGHGAKAVAGYNDYVVKLQAQTGRWAALVGVDYGLSVDPAGISAANQVLKKHWAAGGLVTVSIHFPNPFTGGDAWDRSGVDLTKLTSPGSAAYTKWMSYLDAVAAGLAELRDAGVVVLWRPLHEMNGNWFWWSAKASSFASAAEFTAVWKHMFDHFTKTKGLDNLLWVYAPNAQLNTGSAKATTFYYPGASLVDVVGLDLYLDTLSGINSNQSLSSLLALGKPFGITEYGPKTIRDGSFDAITVIKGIKSYAPQATFWLQWHSWSGTANAIVDTKNATALMTDPWVISRDQVKLPASPPPPPPPSKGAGTFIKQDSAPPVPAKDAAPAVKKDGAQASKKDAGPARPDSGAPWRAEAGGSGAEPGTAPADAHPAESAASPEDGDGASGPECRVGAGRPSPDLTVLALLGLMLFALRRRR